MLDENIASDYGKIMGLFSIGERDTNFAVLDEIINNGEIRATQRRKFDFDKGFDRDDFISLVYWLIGASCLCKAKLCPVKCLLFQTKSCVSCTFSISRWN